jgi:hypothetical protein
MVTMEEGGLALRGVDLGEDFLLLLFRSIAKVHKVDKQLKEQTIVCLQCEF